MTDQRSGKKKWPITIIFKNDQKGRNKMEQGTVTRWKEETSEGEKNVTQLKKK